VKRGGPVLLVEVEDVVVVLEREELDEVVVAVEDDDGLDVELVELTVLEELEDEVLDETELELADVDGTTELLLLEVDAESLYISNLFPAPQYSYLLPGQVNEQSAWLVAKTDPVLRVLPQ